MHLHQPEGCQLQPGKPLYLAVNWVILPLASTSQEPDAFLLATLQLKEALQPHGAAIRAFLQRCSDLDIG